MAARSIARVLVLLGFAGWRLGACEPSATAKGEAAEVVLLPVVWHTRFEPAAALAREEGKVLVIYFCPKEPPPEGWREEREIFRTVAFARYASEHLVLLKIISNPKGAPWPERVRVEYRQLAAYFAVATSSSTLVFLNVRTEAMIRQMSDRIPDSAGFIAQARWIGESPDGMTARADQAPGSPVSGAR